MSRDNKSCFNKFCDLIGYGAVSFVFFLAKILPIQLLSLFFGCLAVLLSPFIPTTYLVLRNLEYTMPELPLIKRIYTMFMVWYNLGQFIGEYPYIYKMKKGKIFKYVNIIDKNFIEEIKNNKTGSIIFSGHLSNWEAGLRALIDSNLKINVVFRESNNPYIEPKYTAQLRENLGIKMIAKQNNAGLKIVRALKNGENVIILTDQRDSQNGLPLNFFGKTAYTSRTIFAIAKKLGVAVYGMRIIRLKNCVKFDVRIEKMDEIVDGIGENEYLQKINDVLERWIRENLEQWFWVHNRWKM